jgi:hypothetical protein
MQVCRPIRFCALISSTFDEVVPPKSRKSETTITSKCLRPPLFTSLTGHIGSGTAKGRLSWGLSTVQMYQKAEARNREALIEAIGRAISAISTCRCPRVLRALRPRHFGSIVMTTL